MREAERIHRQLECALYGEAWHGPSVREILEGLTGEEAAARPLPAAHSIWEIALHLTAWGQIVRRRLAGEVVTEIPPEQDWPGMGEKSAAAWKRVSAMLVRVHAELAEVIRQLPEARLEDAVPEHDYNVSVMLHGVVEHLLYHAGQMAILKKAARGGAGG
jgi:uncharacterized damage-inducible protein DinB